MRQPKSDYLAVPEVSSENRRYIPIDFITKKVIASNLLYTVANATKYTFGILSSSMHMAWVRYVCGRLKSDFRYSSGIVYNNFPWPQYATDAQKAKVEEAAQAVLDARAKYPEATLADLYDPVSMPPALAKAHAALDHAVDRCYRKDPFPSDRARVEFLFALYETLTAPLLPASKPSVPAGGTSKSGRLAPGPGQAEGQGRPAGHRRLRGHDDARGPPESVFRLLRFHVRRPHGDRPVFQAIRQGDRAAGRPRQPPRSGEHA